jgi:hypothetical protein
MKKHTIIIALIVSLICGASAYDDPTPTPTASPSATRPMHIMGGCREFSWNPEMFTFYGDKEAILKKLAKIPETVPLARRRVFLQITQDEKNTKFKLFERQENGKFNVSEWSSTGTARIICEIDEAIASNKGVNCAGEQVKAVLGKHAKQDKMTEAVAAPVSAAAAFSHQVKEAGEDFLTVIIVLMC